MKIHLALLLLLFNYTASAQTFYVNTGYYGLRDANTYKLRIAPCASFGEKDTLPLLHTCIPTQSISSYDDIAVDKDNNIWYVASSGELYKKKSDDTICTYMGDFTPNYGGVNALVADSAGDLYAVSNLSPDSSQLLKYDVSGFHTIGTLPKKTYSKGDLFFYEHRLFLLSYDAAEKSLLTEIVIKAPSQSCHYMSLDSLQAFGAFTIKENNKARTFLLILNAPDYHSSSLVEVDLPNKKILKTTCYYPFSVRGAAAYYELTMDSAKCNYIPQSIAGINANTALTVLNPCTDAIRLSEGTQYSQVNNISLYDLSGKKIKEFVIKDFPGNLNISDLAKGLYILRLIFQDGRQSLQKVQKIL